MKMVFNEKSKTCPEPCRRIENPKLVGIIAAIVFTFAMGGAVAEAQQQKKIPRIGYFGGGANSNPQRLEAFRQGLRELGYVEGKNILLELRFPEGDSQREQAVAAELVRLNVDVIVTVGSNATRRANSPWRKSS